MGNRRAHCFDCGRRRRLTSMVRAPRGLVCRSCMWARCARCKRYVDAHEIGIVFPNVCHQCGMDDLNQEIYGTPAEVAQMARDLAALARDTAAKEQRAERERTGRLTQADRQALQ